MRSTGHSWTRTEYWSAPPAKPLPRTANPRTSWAKHRDPQTEAPDLDIESFLADCFERHGRVYPPPFEARPKPPRDYQAETVRGDALRAQGKAPPLCWLPGEPAAE